MQSNLEKIYIKIKNGDLFHLSKYIYNKIRERDDKIKWYIKEFAKYHEKMYKNNFCDVYNTDIILGILHFIGINTCIYVENLNYVTLYKNEDDEEDGEDSVYFDYKFSKKMFNKIIRKVERKKRILKQKKIYSNFINNA